MTKLLLFVSTIIFLFLFSTKALASTSDYILPYPSFMPGNKLYVIKEAWDKARGIFAFGSFSKFNYELGQADKKLVEAKTLYEYGQLALGNKAIASYKNHVGVLPKLLWQARNENKNIVEKEQLLNKAINKHQEVLTALAKTLPEKVVWHEEQKYPQDFSPQTIVLSAVQLDKIIKSFLSQLK